MAEVQFGADLAGGDAGRFDLVNDGAALAVGENAVGPALDGAADAVHLPAAREKDLGLVALPRLLLQLAVDAGALVGPVKAGKTAVDVAGLEQKLHQLADRQTDLLHGFTFLVVVTFPARCAGRSRG